MLQKNLPIARNDLELANHSILYINFGDSKVEAYEQTIQYFWYELLANFGGLSSLTFGASIMSIIELIYFATGKFGTICVQRMKRTTPEGQNFANNSVESKRKRRERQSPEVVHQLYWNEFRVKPRRPKSIQNS